MVRMTAVYRTARGARRLELDLAALAAFHHAEYACSPLCFGFVFEESFRYAEDIS